MIRRHVIFFPCGDIGGVKCSGNGDDIGGVILKSDEGITLSGERDDVWWSYKYWSDVVRSDVQHV